jgi:aminoglycoside N3'-acetyltransferase
MGVPDSFREGVIGIYDRLPPKIAAFLDPAKAAAKNAVAFFSELSIPVAPLVLEMGVPSRRFEVLFVGSQASLEDFLRLMKPSGHRIGKDDAVFATASTPADTGIFAETVRKHPDAIRSRHPTCSVAAIGRLARFLTQGHDHRSRAFLPYTRLAAAGGKILSIGIGDKLAGFRHEAQALAGLLTVVPWKLGCRFVDEHGAVRIFIPEDFPSCVKRLHELVPPLRAKGIVTDGQVGRAGAVTVPAEDALIMMTEMLKSHPESYLCEDFRCLWCREVERRMGLYSRLENRRWFQKNPLAIAMIAVANWLRFGGNPIVFRLRQLTDRLGVQPPRMF